MKHEIKAICRVCLQCDLDLDGASGVSNIFAMSDKCFVYEKLNSIAEVNIKPEDGLPDKICAECLIELENAINFKLKCETSNNILLSAASAGDWLKGEEAPDEELKEEPDEYTEHKYLEEDPASPPESCKAEKPQSLPDSCKVGKPDVQEQPQNPSEIQLEAPPKKSRAKDLKLECHDCGNLFKSKCKLKVHWFKVHLKAQLTCNICRKVIGSFEKLKDHKANRTKKCITLSQVDISGEGKSLIMQCRECMHFTSNIKNMTLHLEKHAGDTQLFICKLCPKRYLNNSSLKAHMEFEHNEKKVEKTCTTCGEVVIGRRKYRQHLVKHRNKLVLCKICDKLVKQRNYKQHIIIHSNEKNYCCDQCGASFKRPSGLYVHQNEVHRKEEKFTCERCGYCNGSKLKMNRHRHKHTDHDDFACNICGIFLPNNFQLISHKKRHIARNYKCPLCKDIFFRIDSLKKHMNKVHLKDVDTDQQNFLLNDLELSLRKKRFVKNYKCSQCEARYCRKSSLEKHINRVHSIVQTC